MYAAKIVVVLHVGVPGPILATLRRATQGEIDKTDFTLINMLSSGFDTSIINRANMVYLIDIAVWHPILHEIVKTLIQMGRGPQGFRRIDIFACPWPSPWLYKGLSDAMIFLDYLPPISLHAYSDHYVGA